MNGGRDCEGCCVADEVRAIEIGDLVAGKVSSRPEAVDTRAKGEVT